MRYFDFEDILLQNSIGDKETVKRCFTAVLNACKAKLKEGYIVQIKGFGDFCTISGKIYFVDKQRSKQYD